LLIELDRQSDLTLTGRIIEQGKAFVRAIEALGIIESSGPFEQAMARWLPVVYKRRLCRRGRARRR
jgi:hypothetical protein